MTDVVLAVDLGGTKVFTQFADLQGHIVFERRFNSAQYNDFNSLVTELLSLPETTHYRIKASCLAVAGPVVGNVSDLTNLPWVIDGQALSNQFQLGLVTLCNDFVAVAHGIDLVAESDLVCLQQGQAEASAPRAVIGAGTGLGQAIMLPSDDDWHVVATEGGNVDFGPRDDQQMTLMQALLSRWGQVSYERLLSGPGLETLYQFVCHESGLGGQSDSTLLKAEKISSLAATGQDENAVEAMRLFMRIYGAQAGNLALSVIARGGLYIAGGIAAKNTSFIMTSDFLDAFLEKGKMAGLMPLMPVTLITDEKVGLSGARHLALQSAL